MLKSGVKLKLGILVSIIIFSFIVSSFIVTSTPGDHCNSNIYCNGGEFCDAANTCTLAQGPGADQIGNAEGGLCENNQDCRNRHVCLGGSCVRLRDQGESCRTTACLPWLFCADGSCITPRHIGETCNDNSYCVFNYCNNGICSLPPQPQLRSNGSPCNLNNQCQSNICHSSRCSAEDCTLSSRNGTVGYGCISDSCSSHRDCARFSYCTPTGSCAPLTDNRCILLNDCFNNNECYRGFCQTSYCYNDRACGEGSVCTNNRCVVSNSNLCGQFGNWNIQCPNGFNCVNRQCFRACASDFNCQRSGVNPANGSSAEICANNVCSYLCNQEFNTPYVSWFNPSIHIYSQLNLDLINPYSFNYRGSTINLRRNTVTDHNNNTRAISNSIGYKGQILYRGGTYKVIIVNRYIYFILPTNSYISLPLENTNELGVYSFATINLEDGTQVDLTFYVESRTLSASIHETGLTLNNVMTPFVAYRFSSVEGIFYAMINNCDISFDCTQDSHCNEGSICRANTCVRQRATNPFYGFGNFNNAWNIDPHIFDNQVNGCTNNADCAPGEACNAGVCNIVSNRDQGDEGGIQGACADNSNCQVGEVCMNGICSAEVNEDNPNNNNNNNGGNAGGGGGSGNNNENNAGQNNGIAVCLTNSNCPVTKYCSEGSCIDKNSITLCHDQSGVVCNINEGCLSGNGTIITNVRCCIGTNNGCTKFVYSTYLKSRALVVKGDCIDDDNKDGKGLRQVMLCYPDSKDCTPDSNNLIPAEYLNINSNPYNEECIRPTSEDLKTPLSKTTRIIIIVIASIISFLIVVSLIGYFIYKNSKKK